MEDGKECSEKPKDQYPCTSGELVAGSLQCVLGVLDNDEGIKTVEEGYMEGDVANTTRCLIWNNIDVMRWCRACDEVLCLSLSIQIKKNWVDALLSSASLVCMSCKLLASPEDPHATAAMRIGGILGRGM